MKRWFDRVPGSFGLVVSILLAGGGFIGCLAFFFWSLSRAGRLLALRPAVLYWWIVVILFAALFFLAIGIFSACNLAGSARLVRVLDRLAGARDLSAFQTATTGNVEVLRIAVMACERFNQLRLMEKDILTLEEEHKQLRLRSQINPHFLYNTIDSIRGQAMSEGFLQVANVLEAFAIMARDTFNSDELLRSFERELTSVENFLLIQDYRFSGKYVYHTELDREDSALMGYMLPILTLQPIIENALLHGLDSYSSGGRIVLRARRTNAALLISIEDNGVGMEVERVLELNRYLRENDYDDRDFRRRHSGIALANINARLNYYFGGAYGIEVESTPGVCTTVNITLPIGGPRHVQ